jgi:hypothetical protein
MPTTCAPAKPHTGIPGAIAIPAIRISIHNVRAGIRA